MTDAEWLARPDNQSGVSSQAMDPSLDQHPIKPIGRDLRMVVAPKDRDRYEQIPYQPFTADFLTRLLSSADLFVDVGAHYGFFTLLAATHHPTLKIVTIELTSVTYDYLRRSVALLGPSNIDLHQLVAWETAVTVDSLLRERAATSLIVKISVQGNELAVLRGMKETLKRAGDVRLFIELDPAAQSLSGEAPNALFEFVFECGYEAWCLDEETRHFRRLRPNSGTRAHSAQRVANFYCVRRDRALSICFFSHQSRLSGSERVMLELIDDLVTDYGAVCSVVVPGPGPQVKALERLGAASIVAKPYGWWCTDSANVPPDSVRDRFLAECTQSLTGSAMSDIHQFDPDIIWTQTMVIPWGAVFAAELRKPHVWYVTESGEQDFGFNFLFPFSQISREIVASSDQVFTCSRLVADTVFKGQLREKIAVLYCNVQVPATTDDDAAPAFFRYPDAVKLGTFGWVRSTKRQEDIVRAVARLRSLERNVELVIAGGQMPAYAAELADLARSLGVEQRIAMVGELSDPFPAMRACDIVVASSRYEAFGRVGVEAMLLGKPVVYAEPGGMSEYMVDGETGLSYPAGDAERLAVRLDRLVADPELRRAMGDRGRARAIELFGKDQFSGYVYRAMQEIRARGRVAAGMPAGMERIIEKTGALSPQRLSFLHIRNDPCPCGSG